MSALPKSTPISVEDYLEGELRSPCKHEYIAGEVRAMAGARNRHNVLTKNLLVEADIRLEGHRCQPYNQDTKIRVRYSNHVRFYYPDMSIVCEPNSLDDSFQDQPVVIAEVLSERTRWTDTNEKRESYLTIPSLKVYLLLEQGQPLALVYRRSGQEFVREEYAGLEAVIPLPEVGIEIPLSRVYRNLGVSVEVEDDEF